MEKKERGGIVKVSDLFEKYVNRLVAPQGSVVNAFAEVVEDLFGFRIKKEQCSYSTTTKTLALSLPGPVKSEILLRKKEVLTHLRGRLGERSTPREIV